jgi:hypothetical protein
VSFYQHDGANTVDFHKLKRAGKIIPATPWNQWQISGSITKQAYALTNTGDWRLKSTKLQTGRYPEWYLTRYKAHQIHIEHGIEINNALPMLQAAAAAIYSRGWDALTFFAELHHVVSLFKDLVRKATDMATGKGLQNSWLEGRYGWRILYYDMVEISELLSKIEDKRTRLKERVGDSQSDESVSLEVIDNSLGTGIYTFSILDQVETSYRGSIIADISPPDIIFNPVLTAWELIPYSFVIDWFIHVGRFIESLSFLALATDYSGAIGMQTKITRKAKFQSLEGTRNYSDEGTQFESICVANNVRRVPRTVPTQPFVNVNLNAFKVFDLVALFLQRL